ncbi:MAG: YfcE family phosphodiesterase [Deltaproteobacteria bacterium]|nr:YfcE family phosphodiesterase [Deltaproteobacteria bacterium]
MLLGVVSDTHGNIEGMRRLAELLKTEGVSTVLHVGDDYRDLEILEQFGLEVKGVPGVWCREYSDPRVPNRLVVELNGVKILLTHTESRHRNDAPGDPDPQVLAQEVQIVLFGHSHRPALEDRQGVLWLNPGHLKNRQDRGYPPTFALLALSPEKVAAKIRGLEDEAVILQTIHFLKG